MARLMLTLDGDGVSAAYARFFTGVLKFFRRLLALHVEGFRHSTGCGWLTLDGTTDR